MLYSINMLTLQKNKLVKINLDIMNKHTTAAQEKIVVHKVTIQQTALIL